MLISKRVTQKKENITCKKGVGCNSMYVIKYFQLKNIQQELKTSISLALSGSWICAQCTTLVVALLDTYPRETWNTYTIIKLMVVWKMYVECEDGESCQFYNL